MYTQINAIYNKQYQHKMILLEKKQSEQDYITQIENDIKDTREITYASRTYMTSHSIVEYVQSECLTNKRTRHI